MILLGPMDGGIVRLAEIGRMHARVRGAMGESHHSSALFREQA